MDVFNSNFVKTTYEADKKLLNVIWTSETKLFTDKDFQGHVREYALFTTLNPVQSIFVDAREYVHIVTEEIQKWHDNEIVPQYIKNGVKKIAFVQPEEIFAQLGHQFIFDEAKAKDSLQVAFFSNEQEARTWLSK
jgi:hypothetical protein